jgi:hypothetical protein
MIMYTLVSFVFNQSEILNFYSLATNTFGSLRWRKKSCQHLFALLYLVNFALNSSVSAGTAGLIACPGEMSCAAAVVAALSNGRARAVSVLAPKSARWTSLTASSSSASLAVSGVIAPISRVWLATCLQGARRSYGSDLLRLRVLLALARFDLLCQFIAGCVFDRSLDRPVIPHGIAAEMWISQLCVELSAQEVLVEVLVLRDCTETPVECLH